MSDPLTIADRVFSSRLLVGTGKFSRGALLLVFAIGLSLGGTTGYAINPARDLGPHLAHFFLPVPGKCNSDWAYAWVPVAGPLLGELSPRWPTWRCDLSRIKRSSGVQIVERAPAHSWREASIRRRASSSVRADSGCFS